MATKEKSNSITDIGSNDSMNTFFNSSCELREIFDVTRAHWIIQNSQQAFKLL